MNYPPRVQRALDVLAHTTMWRSTFAPPIFRIMWAMGIDILPPHFQSVKFNVLFNGTWFGLLWGVLMWFTQWGPNGESLISAVTRAAVAGFLFGVFMSFNYSYGASKWHLNRELIDPSSAPPQDADAAFTPERISTDKTWSDLALPPDPLRQLQKIGTWIMHHHEPNTEQASHAPGGRGYAALFHGPPGSGKTLAATLIGKDAKREVYRVDLSQIISKYIGETEKNLERVFRAAEHKNWILFFDEADALFGKRTEVRDAHDKYANQEVAYLATRLETYDGLVILASNMRSNVDEAFTRRLQAIVHFPTPQGND